MLLPIQIAALTLGVPLPDQTLEIGGFGDPEAGRRIEYAARTRAVERWPLLDGEVSDAPGDDGCPPAAVRHVLAGALVGSLVTGMGFPYGEPPGATEAEFDRVPDGALTVLGDEAADYPDAPHYALANALCEAALGVSHLHDREGPSNNQTPAEVQAAVIDLAIDLLCAPEPMAEIAAGFAAWLLSQYRSSWAAARARRMLSLVGVRFPREAKS